MSGKMTQLVTVHFMKSSFVFQYQKSMPYSTILDVLHYIYEIPQSDWRLFRQYAQRTIQAIAVTMCFQSCTIRATLVSPIRVKTSGSTVVASIGGSQPAETTSVSAEHQKVDDDKRSEVELAELNRHFAENDEREWRLNRHPMFDDVDEPSPPTTKPLVLDPLGHSTESETAVDPSGPILTTSFGKSFDDAFKSADIEASGVAATLSAANTTEQEQEALIARTIVNEIVDEEEVFYDAASTLADEDFFEPDYSDDPAVLTDIVSAPVGDAAVVSALFASGQDD
jgi:hypothetical protein